MLLGSVWESVTLLYMDYTDFYQQLQEELENQLYLNLGMCVCVCVCVCVRAVIPTVRFSLIIQKRYKLYNPSIFKRHSIRDIGSECGIPNPPQSPDKQNQS